MRYIYFTCLVFLSTISSTFALSSDELKTVIIPPSGNGILSSTTDARSWEWFLDAILIFVKDSVFALIVVVAIGVFLFIWGRLIVARGNPEEFKKALQSFIYAAIGIFVVAAAWAMVRLIAWLDI